MSLVSRPAGRRERNKQAKLDRILAAAGELFAEHGVDEVTTQQIADRADIGTGTLFLYAKTKGELLLLVQNAHYASALEAGRTAAAARPDTLDALTAIIGPIVVCNRVQVENGRAYLREMVFGDPTEPRHREALDIVEMTERAMVEVLLRHGDLDPDDAQTIGSVISAVMFVNMAANATLELSTADITSRIREQIRVILAGRCARR